MENLPPQLITSLISFVVGFISGGLARHFLCVKDKKLIKASEGLAWIFAIVWLALHVYGLVSGAFKLPWVFDVLGGLTIGHVMGFDIGKVVDAIKRK